jgi:fused signal recognition particle receptor
MLVVWIVVAIVVVLVAVGLVALVGPRRGGKGPGTVSAAGPTTEAPPRPARDDTAGPEDTAAPDDATSAGGATTAPSPGETALPEDEAAVPSVAAAPELRERMGRTRGLLSGYLRGLRARASVDDATWDDLEEALLRADVGVATTTSLLQDLRDRVRAGDIVGPDALVEALRADLRDALTGGGDRALHAEDGTTNVWLFVGVNGVGKTTTIGKVARQQVEAGRSVLLAAGDTFRAAAADQLDSWAQRAEVPIVRGAEGSDPSAVVFDAVQRAAARHNDLVLADTAGRLHTKVNLVEELKKIRRVADRDPGEVREVLLVLDATTGQNGLTQARQFTDAVGVTGVVLTKLDGTAKGGIVVAIQRELGLPVKLVGIGEGPDDLVPFDPTEFVDALFE